MRNVLILNEISFIDYSPYNYNGAVKMNIKKMICVATSILISIVILILLFKYPPNPFM